MIKDAAVGGLSRAADASRRGDVGVASSLFLTKTERAERCDCSPSSHLVKFGSEAKTWNPRFQERGQGVREKGGPAPRLSRRSCAAPPRLPAARAHLTLDRSPVFRSGLPAPSS